MKRLTLRNGVVVNRTSFTNLGDGCEIHPNSLFFRQITTRRGDYAEGVAPEPITYFVDHHLAWVKQRQCGLNAHQQLAYKFVHASFFEANPESIYILLFTGVEALIPKRFRKKEYVDVLRRLRSNLEAMHLDESAKKAIGDLLEYKENESIRYRDRNWVQLLGDELFDGKTPEDYFLDAYVTRNKVAHGNVDRPTAESLNEQIPELRRYLLALLDMTVFGELMPAGILGFKSA